MNTLVRFFKDESGATMVEYAILVALIAVAVVAIIFTLGGQINTAFTTISNCLNAPDGGECVVGGGADGGGDGADGA